MGGDGAGVVDRHLPAVAGAGAAAAEADDADGTAAAAGKAADAGGIDAVRERSDVSIGGRMW